MFSSCFYTKLVHKINIAGDLKFYKIEELNIMTVVHADYDIKKFNILKNFIIIIKFWEVKQILGRTY